MHLEVSILVSIATMFVIVAFVNRRVLKNESTKESYLPYENEYAFSLSQKIKVTFFSVVDNSHLNSVKISIVSVNSPLF